jgi:glycosyltransferase involved in cell wall biosynthesis
MQAHPLVSVIIPVFNDQERLTIALTALENQSYPGPYEILVVDNGSTELPVVTGRARLLSETRPGSYNARNRALKEAGGEVIAFTDSDCIPATDWLEAGVNALRANPAAGLIGGKVILFAEDAVHPTLAEAFEMATGFPQKHYVVNGHYAATANVFTRREVLKDVGFFDGTLKSGGDAEWGNRVFEAGYALAYDDRVIIRHPARSSHAEIARKVRRTTGGERDRRPGVGNMLRFSIRHLFPPRRRLCAIFRMSEMGVGLRLRLLCYAIYINWLHSFERVRLQLSGIGSDRS